MPLRLTVCGPALVLRVRLPSGFKVGGSLTAVTVIEMVAGEELDNPSFARKVKLSAPKKFAAGMYVRSGGVPVREPLDGGVITENVRGSPSGSLPVRVMERD
jgi:hypothetical protein